MYENGMNQSFVNINGKKKYKNLKWNADYNGEIANIYLKSNDNGRKKIYNFMLDNNDLANMLNVNTNDMLIDERLKQDFKQLNSPEINPKKDLMIIEFENNPYLVSQNLQEEMPIQEIYSIPSLKKIKTKKSSRHSSRKSSTHSSRKSSTHSSRQKPKSHKDYKIYKNSKSICYIKNKKTSKRTL
jgi:hypothetical protein